MSAIPILDHNKINSFKIPLENCLQNLLDFPPIYTEIIQKIYKISTSLSSTITTRAIETTLAVALMEKNSDAIANFPNELDRVKFITKLTGINAEPGLVPGKEKQHILNILQERISLLSVGFKKADAINQTTQFFKEAFNSDPCLNGRLARLNEYFTEMEVGIIEEIKSDHSYDQIIVIFTELMYGINDEEPPSKKEFITYLKDQKDYSNVYKKWVESPDFSVIFYKAREAFI